MHCLARDPQFRPASAAELAQELAGAAEVPTERLLATAVTERVRARTFRSVPGGATALWIGAATVVALIAVFLGMLDLGGGGDSSEPPQVVQIAPPARGTTPEEQARNLSAWLRTHSR
jgi:hypothetical protein